MILIREAEELIEYYQRTDPERMEKVKKRLEQKGKNWDRKVPGCNADIALLLAYEFCIGASKSMHLDFDYVLDRLFGDSNDRFVRGIDKFRLGELKEGDEDILYSAHFDDEDQYIAMSPEYDEDVRQGQKIGAMHFTYFDSTDKLSSAVCIFGNKEGVTTGCNFTNLSELRQIVFHEFSHHMETIILPNVEGAKIERTTPNGRKFRTGNIVTRYRKVVDGELSPYIDLPQSEQFIISTGLAIEEIVEPSEEHPTEIIMRNEPTEGAVEGRARDIMRAVMENLGYSEQEIASEIDETKNQKQVEIVERIFNARDRKLGITTTGAQYFKNSRVVLEDVLESDEELAIWDYLEQPSARIEFLGKVEAMAKKKLEAGELTQEKIDEMKALESWQKDCISDIEAEEIARCLLLLSDEELTLTVDEYKNALEEDREKKEKIL